MITFMPSMLSAGLANKGNIADNVKVATSDYLFAVFDAGIQMFAGMVSSSPP